MSRSPYPTYPPHHPHHGRPYIEVHPHDILCGRGVNIASHPGNERFRALVQTRYDDNYCTAYSTSEKRAVAEEILRHIKSLDPPGRFLKRMGRAPSSRGLNGPWEELTDREAVKKTCQALRDCNRADRTGYAAQVPMPDDVRQHAQSRSSSGLSNKQQAAIAAAQKTRAEAGAALGSPVGSHPYPNSTPSHQHQHQQQPIHPMPHPAQHAVPHAGHHPTIMGVANTPEGAVLIPYPPGGIPGVVPIPMTIPHMHPHMHQMPARPDMNNGSQGFSPGPMQLHPPPPQHHSLHAYPPHRSHGHPHHLHSQPSDQAQGQQSHECQDQHAGQPAQAHPHHHQQQQQQDHHRQQHQQQHQRHQAHPLRHPGEGSLKRPKSSLEGKSDSDSSPSDSQSVEWHKRQRTNDLDASGTAHTPSNAFLDDSLLSGYDIGVSARTPSHDTTKTAGTTPTTAATSAGRSHASNRTSLSSAALPPSPTLAYDPHNILPVAANTTFYTHHDFMAPPTPMHGDNSFMYHHSHDHHPVVSTNPSSELKQSYHNGNATLDEQQLQAAAEAAAAAMAAGDAHNGNGYNSSSPGHFGSEDDAHSLVL